MNRFIFRVNPSIGSGEAGGWEIPKTKMAIERDKPNQGFTVQVQLKQDTLDVEKKTPVMAKKNSVWRIENGIMKEIFLDADNLPIGGRKMKINHSSWGKFGYDSANNWKPPSKGLGPDSVAKILAKTRQSKKSKGFKHNPFQSSVFRSMEGLKDIMFDGRKEDMPAEVYQKKAKREGYESVKHMDRELEEGEYNCNMQSASGDQVISMLGPLMQGANLDIDQKLLSLL
jgi:hypothetical protein